MKMSKFSDEQIAMALRQAEAGTPIGEICRKLGVSEVLRLRLPLPSVWVSVPLRRDREANLLCLPHQK